jgi:WXG100 family type VII secretion target
MTFEGTMADHLSVDTEHAFNTSHTVSNDAEELREQLAGISRDWDNLARGWSGVAASTYASIWQEWHEGAAKLVDALAESSRSLGVAAVRYSEQDADSAGALNSTPVDLGL